MQRFDVSRSALLLVSSSSTVGGSLSLELIIKRKPRLGKTMMDAIKNEPIWRSSAPHTAETFFTESTN